MVADSTRATREKRSDESFTAHRHSRGSSYFYHDFVTIVDENGLIFATVHASMNNRSIEPFAFGGGVTFVTKFCMKEKCLGNFFAR